MSLLFKFLRDLQGKPRGPAPTLYDLFLCNRRGDVHKWHHYFDVYETYLARMRGQPITLLEIGLWRGGSLRMWREYFGPGATIIGIDISPGAAEYRSEGFEIFIGDQADPVFLQNVLNEIGTVDVVIDDGGHSMRQQVNTFETLYPAATRLYIVEDTHSSYWARFQDRTAGTFIDYAKQKVDLLHEWHWNPDSFELHRIPPGERPDTTAVSQFCATTRAVHFYDSIVVFEKGENKPRWHEVR